MSVSELLGSSVIYSSELVSLLTSSGVGKQSFLAFQREHPILSIIKIPNADQHSSLFVSQAVPSFRVPELFIYWTTCSRKVLFVVLSDVQPFMVVSPPPSIVFAQVWWGGLSACWSFVPKCCCLRSPKGRWKSCCALLSLEVFTLTKVSGVTQAVFTITRRKMLSIEGVFVRCVLLGVVNECTSMVTSNSYSFSELNWGKDPV